MGATVSELTLIDLKIEPGTAISKGQKIAELESDKSVFEYESPCDGVVAAIRCRPGDIVASGGPFLRIKTADVGLLHLRVTSDAPIDVVPTPAVRAPITAPVVVSNVPAAAVPASAPVSVPTGTVASAKGPIWTPRAVKLAQEAGLDPLTLTDITATGPGGRVSGDDVTQYLARRQTPAVRPVVASVPSVPADRGGRNRVHRRSWIRGAEEHPADQ
jgi:pyruvate/2-oxoglutarate dehydrogenase complex dihydrolipoamide acyltransferase (E2) component